MDNEPTEQGSVFGRLKDLLLSPISARTEPRPIRQVPTARGISIPRCMSSTDHPCGCDAIIAAARNG